MSNNFTNNRNSEPFLSSEFAICRANCKLGLPIEKGLENTPLDIVSETEAPKQDNSFSKS